MTSMTASPNRLVTMTAIPMLCLMLRLLASAIHVARYGSSPPREDGATEEFLTFMSDASASSSRYSRRRNARAGRRGREEGREGAPRRTRGRALRRAGGLVGRRRLFPGQQRGVRLRSVG